MLLTTKGTSLRKIANAFPVMACVLLSVQLLSAPAARALEVLAAHELASHCSQLKAEPEGVDGQYCIRYIQGYIDGAIATDARIMLNAEQGSETFTERAMRTRIPGPADRSRAASMAGFCFDDPLPLRDIVDIVARDLTALQSQNDSAVKDEPAMEVVYNSLLKNYPCKL
jgi:hypothetical protein